MCIYFSQCLWAAPTVKPETEQAQEQLKLEAHNETINLLNALFRAQIAYFSGVREKLAPTTKRARDIALYVSRLNEAIAEKDLDKKDALWLNIFDQVSTQSINILYHIRVQQLIRFLCTSSTVQQVAAAAE